MYENATDFINYIHPDDRKQVRDAMERVTDGHEFSLEHRVNPDEKYERWVRTIGALVYDEAGTLEMIVGTSVGTSTDITEQKHLREQLENEKQRAEKLASKVF